MPGGDNPAAPELVLWLKDIAQPWRRNSQRSTQRREAASRTGRFFRPERVRYVREESSPAPKKENPGPEVNSEPGFRKNSESAKAT
jgi:hypothetical protein